MSKVNNCLGVMIAKGDSLRLPRKNQLIFTGKPMFLINLEKLLTFSQLSCLIVMMKQ